MKKRTRREKGKGVAGGSLRQLFPVKACRKGVAKKNKSNGRESGIPSFVRNMREGRK